MTKITKRFKKIVVNSLVGIIALTLLPNAFADNHRPRGSHGGLSIDRMDTNSDGELSLAEFTDPLILKSEKMFSIKDRDNDALLSPEELQQGGRRGPREAIDLSLFADDIIQCVSDVKFETDNDNIQIPSANQFDQSGDKFTETDTSGDGAIDIIELQDAMVARATATFDTIDVNIDGSITSEELTAYSAEKKATTQAIRQCIDEIINDV